MRSIHTHIVTDADRSIGIHVVDEPDSGGANHHYIVDVDGLESADIKFQKGPIAENGINGITQEVLLAIVIDRLQCFQRGPYRCKENAAALGHIESALSLLERRTRDRIARGVEGKGVK